VYETLVAPREGTDEWRLKLLEWYMDIAQLLTAEGKAEGGHLDHTLHLIGEMQELHEMLMTQPIGRRYRELFGRLAPALPALRKALGRDDVGDIELAFRGLYAAMLYRMKGTRAEVSSEAVEVISPVVALLADMYHKVERGEIDLYSADEEE
jgi:flagellin-specific chaperone FliS